MTRTMVVVLALAACGGEKKANEAAGSAGKATEPAGSGSATAKAADPGKAPTPPPSGEGKTGELVHGSDRKTMQGFFENDLAVGGGYVYWAEQLRIDKNGTDKTTIRRKKTTDIAAAAEDVAGPMHVFGIAADDQAVYLTGIGAVRSKAHAGGELKELAKGNWQDVYAGDKHLLIRDGGKMAFVPKAGGPLEVVWESSKRSNHEVVASGDKFYVLEHSAESRKADKRAITLYEPGKKPRVIVEAAEVRGHLGVDGDHVYFAGKADSHLPGAPLWRVNATTGGAPEPVGDRNLGFANYRLRNGTLYGMVLDGKWKLAKLPLAGGKPEVLDTLPKFSGMAQSQNADDKHLYYLTDCNVFRAPL